MALNIKNLTAPTLDASSNSIGFNTSWVITKWTNKESWDHLDAWWEFYRPGYKEAGKKPWNLLHYGLGGSSTSDSCSFLRNDPRQSWKIYPLGDWYIGRVNCWVRGSNKKDKPTGWWYSQDLVIWEPPAPELEFKVERKANGAIDDLTLSVKKGAYKLAWINDQTDNYDTGVIVRKSSNTSPAQIIHGFQAYTEDAEVPLDTSNIEQGLLYDEWVKIEADAYSRGCAGDGEHTVISHIFAWPATPQITKVASDEANNTVSVNINTNASTYHPVDTVKLQRLKDSDCETASAAAIASGWADVSGMSDTGNCKGLSDNLINARPAKGKRTWYRIVAQHDEYVTYSVPVDLGIYQPAVEAQAGAATIMGAMSGDDGESVIVDVAWNDDAFHNVTDPSEIAKYKGSTQITWASTEYAWRSTQNASEFDVDWEDDEPRFEGYDHSARVYVGNLTEGEDVFIRVHRVLTNEGETIDGPWSEIVSVKPVTSPAWVELSAPSYIARGESLPLSWTFGSEAEQKAWSIIDDDGKIWGHGEDANSYCIIDAADLVDVSELTLYASVTTGGEWKRSAGAVRVRIAEAPTCSIVVDEIVTGLPVNLSGVSNGDRINYYLVSRGLTYAAPDGDKVQYANDIVWSAQIAPGEHEMNDPAILDGCTYDLRAQAVDDETGLCSDVVSATFKVELERQAPIPDAQLVVNEDELSVSITCLDTDEMMDGDTYEVYRMTKDGVYLIAEDIEPGYEMTDKYAPCSVDGNAYRVAVRTSDGDLSWRDFPYELGHSCIRLDWKESSLDLPYDIEISEGLKKSFESREHLDGSVNGYWDKSVKHEVKFSTSIIRFDSVEDQTLLREVARYAGAVFVRTGSGLAFDANVEVSDIEETCSEGAIGVSLSVEEIELTSEHKVRTGHIAKEEEQDV